VKRRTLVAALLVLPGLAGCGDVSGAGRSVAAGVDAPERIFLFVVDTLRRDHLSAYGAEQPTPHIDAIAAGGQRFDHAVSSFHQTTMSMAALMSGRTPSIESGDASRSLPWTGQSWCGLSRLAPQADAACVPAAVDTLAERLEQAGYWTAAVVSNQLLFDPAGYSQGFDLWREVGKGRAPIGGGRWARLRDARFVDPQVLEVLAKRPGDRFFLYVHWVDVHDYGGDPAAYGRAVVDFDARFGELVQAIGAQGLFEDALVVFTSDHGESLLEPTAARVVQGHMGNPSLEAQLRVPLLARPSLPADPSQLIRTQDIAALILRAAGIDAGGAPADLEPDELFLGERHYQTYRRGRFKSMRARAGGPTLLFDIEADPGERRDVAAQHPDVVARHLRRVGELTRALANDAPGVRTQLTEGERAALRALGYAR